MIITIIQFHGIMEKVGVKCTIEHRMTYQQRQLLYLNLCMFHWWLPIPLIVSFSIHLRLQLAVNFLKKYRWISILFQWMNFDEKLTGTNNFWTSSTARCNFTLARLSVSSTVIRTCKSSAKCSQLGLPLLASSCKL